MARKQTMLRAAHGGVLPSGTRASGTRAVNTQPAGSQATTARKTEAFWLAPAFLCVIGSLILVTSLALAGCSGSKNSKSTANYDLTVAASDNTTATVNGKSDGLCSWTQGGQNASTKAGDDYAITPVAYVNNGTYESGKSLAGDSGKITNTAVSNFAALIKKSGVNGLVINNSTYSVDNATITMEDTGADGTDTCDFSGKGAAIAAYGANTDVTVSDSTLQADGVAGLAAFVDNGASALIKNSTLSSAGGTLYADYVNSPAQELMVAPPWILGIMGTSRTTNLMGTKSTMTVVDSNTSASNWAVLSTDAGSNMALNVANSTLELTGTDTEMQKGGKFNTKNPYTERTGYGTYAIGNAIETFLGTVFNVGTYATIFTGGSAYYGNLKSGETYALAKADGTTHTTYKATADATTVINSDTFGFMAHQNTNSVVLDGVEVNSAFTDFLVKSGCDNVITVMNGTKLNAANGILLQLMDNDDSTTEYDSATSTFGEKHEEYAGFPTEAVSDSSTNKNNMDPGAGGGAGGAGGGAIDPGAGMGGEMPGAGGGAGGPGGTGDPGAGSSGTGGTGDPGAGMGGEKPDTAGNAGGGAGSAGDAGAGNPSTGGSSSGANTTVYNVQDCSLIGSIFNGIGWNANSLSNGNVKQMLLQVNLSGASTLTGAIASTSCIHAIYDGQTYLKKNNIAAFDDDAKASEFAKKYQATSFTQSEYFNIGQVANLVKSNGLNQIDVTVSDDSVWTVDSTSLINSLTISGNAKVIVNEDVTLTVGGKQYTAGTYTAANFA